MSQLRGGIIMGMGIALSEETLLDPRNGRIMNPNLSEYHVPVQADVPPIDVHYLDDPDPTMPLGILGAGEVGIIGDVRIGDRAQSPRLGKACQSSATRAHASAYRCCATHPLFRMRNPLRRAN